jgi:hypothetical protein
MKTILEGNYYGPVEDVLVEDPGRVKSVGMSLDSHLVTLLLAC